MIYEEYEKIVVRARDPLLLNMIEGFPHNLSELPRVDSKESWINGSGIIGRLFLTYLVEQMFNIHRLPFCEEQFYKTADDYTAAKKFFACLSWEQIAKAMQDLLRLYLHTQELLKSGHLNSEFGSKKSDGKIKLKHGVSLNYAHVLIAHTLYASRHGYDTIQLPTWVLSSYACKKAYARDVEFSVWIPIEDILLSSLTVAFSGIPNCLRTSDKEFIVINRNSNGFIDVKVADICFNYFYQEQQLKDTIRDIGLYSETYFKNLYPKPSMLYNFSPTQLKEPAIIRKFKAIYNFFQQMKRV